MSVAQPRSSPGTKTTKPRPNKSNKIGFLEKLHLLQIHGSFKDPKRGQTHKLFDDFPRRLVFSLSQLIEGDDWKSELTFLGFTRDGQFMLSYSCHYSQSYNQMMSRYTYVYYMQWWHFVPYRPLKKIRETRLFGDQEIMDDLALTVCQWPTDDTKLLVYGSPNNIYTMRLDPDVVRCYYITVIAIPPLQPCVDCSAFRVPDTEMNEHLDSDTTDSEDSYQSLNNQKYCLQHSYVIHTRYILVPPYPSFNPFICMKINGLVVINTGDNLIVLSIGLRESDESCLNRRNLLKSNSPNVEQNDTPYSTTHEELDSALETVDILCSRCSLIEPNLPKGWYRRDYLSMDTSKQDTLDIGGLDTEICNECGREMIIKWCSRMNSIGNKDDSGAEFSPTSLPKRNKISDECFKEVVITQDCATFKEEEKSVDEQIGTEVKCLTIQLDNGWSETDCSEIPLKEEDTLKKNPALLIQTSQLVTHNFNKHFEKENISPKLGRIIGVIPRLLSPKETKKVDTKLVDEINNDNSDGALDVPSFGSPLSRPSSYRESLNLDEDKVASSGDSQSHRTSGNCISVNSQYFADWIEQSPSSPSQYEEDSAGTEYHNVLSFEVHGSQYKLLKPINLEKLQNWGGSAISVGQLTFDIEVFAHEMAAQICKTARKKYLAFLDYDVQIIDLCEISSNVIALVIMQVQAMAGQKGVQKEFRSSVRKVFQTGFKFQWNVETGNYKVIDTDELVEVEANSGFLKENGVHVVWNPARLKVTSLRKEFCVPQSLAKSVRVMSNANLPHGESLKVLWAPGQDVAIVH